MDKRRRRFYDDFLDDFHDDFHEDFLDDLHDCFQRRMREATIPPERKTFCVNEILAYKLYSTPLLELPNLQLSPERRIPRNYRHADFASTRFWLCSKNLVRTVWFEQSCFELFDSNYLTHTVWFELFDAQATIRRSEDSEHSLRTPNLGIPSAQSVHSLSLDPIQNLFRAYTLDGWSASFFRWLHHSGHPETKCQFRESNLDFPI